MPGRSHHDGTSYSPGSQLHPVGRPRGAAWGWAMRESHEVPLELASIRNLRDSAVFLREQANTTADQAQAERMENLYENLLRAADGDDSEMVIDYVDQTPLTRVLRRFRDWRIDLVIAAEEGRPPPTTPDPENDVELAADMLAVFPRRNEKGARKMFHLIKQMAKAKFLAIGRDVWNEGPPSGWETAGIDESGDLIYEPEEESL